MSLQLANTEQTEFVRAKAPRTLQNNLGGLTEAEPGEAGGDHPGKGRSQHSGSSAASERRPLQVGSTAWTSDFAFSAIRVFILPRRPGDPLRCSNAVPTHSV